MELLFVESSTKGWGTEQHFAALAISMAKRSHHVRCLMCAGSPLEAVLRKADVPVVSLKFRGSTDPRVLAALWRLVAERKPAWLVTNDGKFYWPLVLLSRLIGARTALFRHWPNMPKKRYTRTWIPRLADRFILVSRFQREHLRLQGIDVDRMPVLYNPIDTRVLAPSEEARQRMRASLGVPDSEVLVTYVGRMVAIKGIFTLFDASERFLAEIPEARMLWVGEGGDLAELRARVSQSVHRSRHAFLHWTAEMRNVYAAADIVVVPSQYPDPCPRVPVEAQSCGAPVVCSDVGGLPETLVPNVTGLQVPSEDPGALSSAVLQLVRDPERRKSMGRAGRDWVCSHLSFDTIGSDFEALLHAKQSA